MKNEGQTDLLLVDKSHITESVYEFSLKMARNSETRKIPIVILADEHKLEEELAAYECGISDYVTHDIHPEILKVKIDKLLQLKRSTDMLERAARIDNLTQIYNRREFEHCFELEWKRSNPQKTRSHY